MDYRYETKDEARDFHRARKAFVILNGKVEFLPTGTPMSHFEYCQTKGIEKSEFNKLTRGYYINGDLIFYKDNFIYDENVIKEGIGHIDEIADCLELKDFDIYFGLIVENNFATDYHYGQYKDGKIIKSTKTKKI